MNYVELALTIADSDMEPSIKKVEIMKLKSELGRKLEINSGGLIFSLILSVLLLPLFLVMFYAAAVKNIKNEIAKIDFILNELELCEKENI